MTRKALLLSLVLFMFASMAVARTRSVAAGGSALPDAKASGATVSGVVTSVSGNLIQIADGLITIDASGAKIVIDRGREGTVAQIETGMLVFAVLKSNDVAANAPLPATTITATRLSDATLFGAVQSVDLAANTFTLLGRTIHVNSETSFGGFRLGGGTPGLSDILPNHIVQAQVESVGGKLVATSVILVTPIVPEVKATRGTVKSIGSDSWVISREKGGDLTLVVNAQTKIIGSPKVGDTVEVLYRIDSANAAIALSIIKFERPSIDFKTFKGTVKSIEKDFWVIEDAKVRVNDRTKIMPGISVGDRVEALAQKQDDGTYLAIVIVKLFR